MSQVLGPAAFRELQTLQNEKDFEIRRHGLLSLAGRLEAGGRPEGAARVYEELPEDERAQERREALEGRGSFGAVFEAQLRNFAREAFEPKTLLPMLAGSAVYGLSRGAVLGRLLANPRVSFWSRGFGARSIASVGAFFAEVPTFALSARGLRSFAEEKAEIPLSRDLAQAGLSLVFLKGFGSAGSSLSRRWNQSPLLFGQSGIFAGLLMAQGLEARLGWRPALEAPAALASALGTMLSLGAGSRLGNSLLGGRFSRLHRELEWRAEASSPSSKGDGLSLQGPSLALGYSGGSFKAAENFGPPIAFSKGGRARIERLLDEEYMVKAWEIFPEFQERKANLSPRDFRLLAKKLESKYGDPAANRRTQAFILLGFLVPYLSPAQRLRHLPHIDKAFADPDPWVREVTIQTFDRNAPFWPMKELERRISELRRLSRDPERRVQEAAFRSLVRMTEFLDPAQRLSHLRTVSQDVMRSREFNFFKPLPMTRALRSMQPEERLEVVKLFEAKLRPFASSFHYLPLFGDMLAKLHPADRLGRVLALEKIYSHRDPLVRIWAITAVDNAMHLLPIQAQGERVERFETLLRSSNRRIKERAVTILGTLYVSEPRLATPERLRRLEKTLGDSDPMVRQAAQEVHQRLKR